jgi:hypothetical protein
VTPLTIEYLPLRALKPYRRNARTHSKDQIQLLSKSIGEFGFTNPILISNEREIIAGHGRLEAAKLADLKTVPCIRLPHLSETQRRALVIADNQLATKAGWSMDLLATELQALIDLNVDVEITGFSTAEIDVVIGDYERKAKDTGPPDVLPPTGPLVTRPGDLWLMGDHRLICGDSRERATYEALMGWATSAGSAPFSMRSAGLGCMPDPVKNVIMKSSAMARLELRFSAPRTSRLTARPFS